MERLGLGLPLTFKWDGLASQTSAYLYLDVPNTILWSTHVHKYVLCYFCNQVLHRRVKRVLNMKGLVSLIPSMLVPVNAPPGMSHSPLLRHKVGPWFLHWRSSCLCIWPSIYVCVWQLPLLKIHPVVNTRCAGVCSVWGVGVGT